MGMLPECPWCHDAFHRWKWSCWPAPSSTPEPPCCVRCHDFGAVQWDDLTDAELARPRRPATTLPSATKQNGTSRRRSVPSSRGAQWLEGRIRVL